MGEDLIVADRSEEALSTLERAVHILDELGMAEAEPARRVYTRLLAADGQPPPILRSD